jgi:hypothetical protein
MHLFRICSLASLLLAIASVPAFAGVIVYSPGNGADVSSSFTVSAFANWCGTQWVTAIGYSEDNSSYTTTVSGQTLKASASSGTGWHTLHVKAWGQHGGVCDTDVSINVSSGSGLAPAHSASVSAIQSLGSWVEQHDGATGGWSSGSMKMTGSPSKSGHAREFYTVYSNHGGELYHAAFSDDEAAHNFVYDTWIYLTGSAANIGNLEMDLNQVMPNGQTVIFGFQCDGYTYTWDYNANWKGPASGSSTWMHSGAPCNIRSWGRNQWHHIQISYSRTDYGVVTYHSVYVDGKEEVINASAPSAYALGWAPVLLTNFQVDGLGASGSVTLFMDDLVIYRW